MAGERRRVLITVRTYPTPSARVVEQSCTAGITSDGEWIRLFPIPWRFLSDEHKFRKYEWIELTVHKARDARPESYNPECDSIEIVGEEKDWQAKKDIVFPLLSHCLCCLKEQRDEHGFPTLGIFKPGTIKRLKIEPDDDGPVWSEGQLAKLNQSQFRIVNGETVMEPPNVGTLQKIPLKFYYEFDCSHETCPGHKLSCTDWEMLEAYRQWRRRYGEGEWESKFREKFDDGMISKLDTHFYVGTVSTHPGSWMIVGLFYPPYQAWDPAVIDHPQPPQPDLGPLLPA